MSGLNGPNLEGFCEELLGAFQGVLSWAWDSRFKTVVAQFSVDIADSVRETLEHYFSMTWHIANIDQSPDILRFVNTHLGGLREKQLLFTSEPIPEGFVFCAWWPWGDGKTISIRVSPFYYKLNELQMVELNKKLRCWFGILED